MKLGILDWGIGGLSVLQKIQAERPSLQGIYFSDSGSTPYGKMSHLELQERLSLIFEYFIQQEVTHIVIACNAASTAFIEENQYGKRPIINVITPTVIAVSQMPFKKVGVIGGHRTVESGLYLKIQELTGKDVFQASAQPLSALIEQGQIHSEHTRKLIESILTPLIEKDIDSLVLACTHYPALTPLLQNLYPHLNLINPADFISALLPQSDSSAPSGISFLTTGNPEEMKSSALKAFDYSIPDVSNISLN